MPKIELKMSGSLEEAFARQVEAVQSHRFLQEHLVIELEDYKDKTQDAFSKNEFIDIALAESIILCAKTFLNVAKHHKKHEEKTPYLLAAVSYLINCHDNQPDFQSIIGFEDDAAVFAALITAFGLKNELLQTEPRLLSFFEHPAVAGEGTHQ